MPIWRTIPVKEEPVIELSQWQVFGVPSRKGKGLDHHFKGFHAQGAEGRVSSKIVEFDRAKMIGSTQSGRKYRLLGAVGQDADADYVCHRWLRVNGAKTSDVVDVTADYL